MCDNMSEDVKKIAVMSGKGGVGKSTVAANLAKALSYDSTVGVFDNDFHGPTIPKLFGVRDNKMLSSTLGAKPVSVSPNLKVVSIDFLTPEEDDPVIWRGAMKMKATKDIVDAVIWGDIDYLVIDLPPGTGDEAMNIAKEIDNLDGVVIVTTPDNVSTPSVAKSIRFAEELEIPVIGIVENMGKFVCPSCGEESVVFGSGGGEELAEKFDVPFLGSIPLDSSVNESGEKGEPFVDGDSGAAEEFLDIVENIKVSLEEV